MHLPFSRTRGLLGRRHGNVSRDQAGAPWTRSFIHLRREIVELKILFIVLNDAHNETSHKPKPFTVSCMYIKHIYF